MFFSGKTYRISKKFCNFLSIQPATYNTQIGTKQAHEVFNKFYTKPEVSKFCVETFTSNIQVQKEDLIIEPSAGGGVFIKPLKNITCYKIFIDIAPENEQVKQYDFLAWKPTNTIGKIHVIGNPPFGKQSSLCLKFIKHAAKFADSISFILPLSFKKQHLLSKIPKNFHMLHETIIEKNAFTYNGVNFKLPTVFQIWKKENVERIEPEKEEPKGFTFVKQAKANIAITRVGSQTGIIKLNHQVSIIGLSKSTHWFIKADEHLFKLLSTIQQLKCESVEWVIGPKSLSKTELTSLLNKK